LVTLPGVPTEAPATASDSRTFVIVGAGAAGAIAAHYAAGDIARYVYRGQDLRVEHWRVAHQHGRVAALAMMARPVPYDAVPMFWTIQYFKQLDYIGHVTSWDEVVLLGDMAKPTFLAYYVKDGRVAAAAGFDRGDDTAALVALFARRQDWTAAELGDSPATVLARLQTN
jgi:hypothetical protein